MLIQNPWDWNLILVPIYMDKFGHWAVLSIHIDQSQIHSYDSLGISHKMDLYAVFCFLKRETERRKIDLRPEAWHLRNTLANCPEAK